ncbi:MAG: MBG domain-containing protein [Bacteroidales bacterium]
MKNKLLLLLALCLSITSSVWAQSNNALNFDGADDYVDLVNFTTDYDFSQGFSFTGWIKWTAFTGNARVFELTNGSNSHSDEILLRTDGGTGKLVIQCASGTTNSEIITDAAVVTTGTWYHVAATISSSGTACIYVNGTLVKSGTVYVPTNIERVNNWLGKSAWSGDVYFNGSLDEVSFWDKALTQSEIENCMVSGLTGTETSLVTYYPFNQGTAESTNSDITTLNSSATTNLTGTLTNFALSGTTSNWVSGYTSTLTVSSTDVAIGRASGSTATFTITSNTAWSISGTGSWYTLDATSGIGTKTITITTTEANTTSAARSIELTISGTNVSSSTITVSQAMATIAFTSMAINIGQAANSTTTLTLTTDVDWTATCSESWLTVSSLSGTGNATLTLTAEALPEGTTSRTANISFSGIFDPATVVVTQREQTDNALNFDGSNDYVVVADNDALDLTTNYTIEAWINPTSFNEGMGIVSKYQDSEDNGYFLRFGWESNPAIQFDGYYTATGLITLGKWYHIAAVNDNGTRHLYLNGTEQSLTSGGEGVVANTSALRIGSDYSERYFNGSIDEVRIWSTARSQSDIIASMATTLAGTETNLVAYYNFNQGVIAGTNTDITTLNSSANADLSGTLTNFALSGTTSNWVSGYELSLAVSSDEVEIERTTSSTATFNIISNTNWAITGTGDWYSLDKTSGFGNSTITVTTTQTNEIDATRSIELVISGTDVANDTITITQRRGSVSASASQVSLSAASGSTASFTLTSNTDWTLNEDCDWFSVSPASGSGNQTITITADLANQTDNARTDTLIIAGANALNDTLIIQQALATFSLSRTAITLDSAANSQAYLTISTEVAWNATCSASWLTVSSLSDTGSDTLTLTAQALPEGVTSRSANVVFTGIFEPAAVVVTQTAQGNNSLSFDGSDDYVSLGAINPSTFTVEAWVKPELVYSYRAIINTLNVTASTGMGLYINGINMQPEIYLPVSGSTIVTAPDPLTAGEWSYIAATCNGSSVNLYVNGILAGSKSISYYNAGTENMTIGDEPGYSRFFKGNIDEVRVWNTARTLDEVNQDMNQQTTGTTGLLAYYNFNQGVANASNLGVNTLNDVTSNCNDGTLNNFVLSGNSSNWAEGVPSNILRGNATTDLGYAAGSTGLVITSTLDWAASSSESWLTLSQETGSGSKALTLTYGDNTTSRVERSAVVTLTATGADTVRLNFTQTAGIRISSAFEASSTENTPLLSISFTDTSAVSNTTITSWAWDFGDGATSSVQSPSHSYASAGTYSVSLVTSDGTTSDTLVKTDYITISREVLMHDGSVTVADSLYFYDSGGENYNYQNSENYTLRFYPSTPGALIRMDFLSYVSEICDYMYIYIDNTSTQLAYQTGTTYTAKVQAPNSNGALCVNFHSDNSVVYSGWKALVTEVLPEVAFTASDTLGLNPLSVTFTDASIMGGLNAWSWNFGDGSTSTDQNPSHTYTATGTYTVTLTISNGTASKTISKAIRVVDAVTASFATDITTGYRPTVQFTNTSVGYTSLSWNFGDGSDAVTDTNPSHAFNTAGTYTVTLTATDASSNSNQCSRSITATKIAPAFSADTTSGYQPVVQFTDETEGATSWSWDFGDGSTSVEQNPSHTYTTAGTYTVSLTASDGYDTETLVKNNFISAKAIVAAFSADKTLGALPTVTFTDASQGNITSWNWDFGDGSTSVVQNPVHKYTTCGIYTVSLTVSDGVNSKTLVKENYITTDVLLMSNDTVTLTSGANIRFYDSGNNNSDYSGNERYKLVLYPSEVGKAVQVNFSSFYTENYCDYLEIYNGTSTSATRLAYQIGSSYNSTVTATNADGALCLYFYSDGSMTFNGWEALISQVDLQTIITWDTPAEATYGSYAGADIMNATANVAGSFSYSFSADSIFDAGVHTLTVTFTPDNSNYSAATETVSYTVNKAELLATADNLTLQTGSTIPELTFTYSGFVNGDDVSDLDLAPVATTKATSSSAAGSYSIYVLAGTDNNYNLSYQKGTLTLTTLSVPVITWDAPADITYGTALSATQLNAATTVDGTFTYSPSVDSVLNAGNAQALNVTFIPSDGTTYASASKTVTINVGKAPLTATANYNRAYGSVNPELAISYTGLVNNDDASVLDIAPVASVTADTLSTAGTYTITLSEGTDNNYEITSVNGTLTISPAVLSVTAENKSKIYGEANPAFTYTCSGFVNSEDATVLNTLPTATCTADATTNAGTIAITVSGGADDNYSFVYNNGTLTIGKDTLTATVASASKVYGNVNPGFTITYSGFENNDDESVIDETPVATCDANQTSAVGNYNISLSGGSDNNYTFKFVNNSLSVTARTLTLSSFTADNKVYDASTTVTGTGFSDDRVNSDELTFTYSAAFADKNAGTGKTVNYTNIAISGGSGSANYSLASTSGTASADITTQQLTVSNLVASSKVYDGTTTATLSGGELSAVISGDVVTVTMPTSGTFAQANVGTGIGVNFATITLSGTDAANYTLTQPELSSDITPASLAITANNIVKTKGQAYPFAGTEFTTSTLYGSNAVNTVTLASDGALVGADEGEYPIIASNAQGNGLDNYSISYSAGTLTVTAKQVPVIAWSNPESITYGTALSTAQLNAAVDVEGTFVYYPAQGSILNAGNNQTLTVTFTPSDGSAYAAATKSVVINVNKAVLTVAADNQTIQHGAAIPTLTFGYSGFVNNERESVLNTKPVATTTATVESPVGEYPIIVTGGVDENYSFTYVNGTLSITDKLIPIITWNSPSDIVYGTALNATQLNATCNAEGTFAYSPAIGSILNAGNGQVLSVTFMPNDQDAYAEVTQSTTINVTKSLLTVRADDQSIMIGSSIPQLTFQYDGFVNGDDENDLDVRPTATAAATAASPVGEYPITVSGGSDSNYQFSYVEGILYIIENQSLTVSTAELTIGAAANSTVDFTITSNVSWTISSAEGWLSISSTSGTGDATITLSAEANPNTAERTAAVTVAGDGVESKTILVTQSAAVGINDNTLSAVKVYPNPASDLINVHLPDGLENVTVELLSINGVKLSVIETSGNVTPINVSALTKGIYILRITSANSNRIVRWIKN